jgi:twitching motility protein PilT
MKSDELLHIMGARKASDLHLKTGAVPVLRVHGNLVEIPDVPAMSQEALLSIFKAVSSDQLRARFAEEKELDFSFQGPDQSRFRINACIQRGEISLAFRRIPKQIPSLDELGLPAICRELVAKRQGLVLVTGPTGSGKSTTLAAMIDHLNRHESKRVVTIEDPIEYVYQDRLGFITQRELGRDTRSFAVATRQSLRQDPDCILVGEMRDLETMAACLTAAETGHLVLSTLHTNSAPQTIDRLVDSFPPHQQTQIRMQLSLVLLAVLSQALLPRPDGSGRVPALEIMVATPAIRNLIREGKTHQMISVLQTGREMGMQTMEQALEMLYRGGQITLETALAYANDEATLRTSLAPAG